MSSISAAASSTTVLFTPMRAGNVPRIDLRYWVAISAASVFGCNLGDFVSLYLHLGHWIGLFPLAAMFFCLTLVERGSKHSSEAWYWAVVIVLRTAATNLADLATHTFSVPYPWFIAAVGFLQALVILRTSPRCPKTDPTAARRPAADGWYWVSLLTAGVLGTAIGDGVAESLHLGTGLGTIILCLIMLVFIALGARSRWASRPGYWLAIIAVRAAGTMAGDWLAFGEGGAISNGLSVGLPIATAATGAVFLLILCFWRSRRD